MSYSIFFFFFSFSTLLSRSLRAQPFVLTPLIAPHLRDSRVRWCTRVVAPECLRDAVLSYSSTNHSKIPEKEEKRKKKEGKQNFFSFSHSPLFATRLRIQELSKFLLFFSFLSISHHLSFSEKSILAPSIPPPLKNRRCFEVRRHDVKICEEIHRPFYYRCTARVHIPTVKTRAGVDSRSRKRDRGPKVESNDAEATPSRVEMSVEAVASEDNPYTGGPWCRGDVQRQCR